MSDTWIDCTQEYEGGTSQNVIATISNTTELLENNGTITDLIKLVQDFPIEPNVPTPQVVNLYILNDNTDGEIRFYTKDARNNNDYNQNYITGNYTEPRLLYNTKIGKDGKIYYFHNFTITNPVKLSGWYELDGNFNSIEIQLTILDVGIASASAVITALQTQLNAHINLTLTNFTGVNATLANHEVRLNFIEFSPIEGLNIFDWDATSLNANQIINTARSEINTAMRRSGLMFQRIGQRTINNNRSIVIRVLEKLYENATSAIGAIAFAAGVYAILREILDEKKREAYRDELMGISDNLSQLTLPTTTDTINHTRLTIVSGNTGFTSGDTTYRVSIQRDAIIVININSSLVASVINVENNGSSTFSVGETISIPKASLGGGTGDDLVLSVASLGTLKEWTELRATYLQNKILGLETKNRRKQGVIGADDIDTTQFTTTNVSFTDTTDTITETITYKQLKSRLNLLPTGTSDVDVYTNTGKIGIGTTPAPYTPLHIYHETDSVARIQSGTSGISQLQFIRGVEADALIDFRLVNDTNLFRLQFQDGASATQFGDGNSFLMDLSTTKTRFYKDLQVSGKVGINTTPDADISLDVNGTTRFMDNVAIGTTPPNLGDFFQPQLKVYSTGDTTLYLRGGASYSTGVEFGRGNREDATLDFRIVSRVGENGLMFQFQDDLTTYDNAESELMLLKPSGANFFTSFSVGHNVGIGTDAELYSTNRLRVDGTTKITNGDLYLPDGRMGIGTLDPQTPLHIVSTTGDTKLTIEDIDDTAFGFPTDIIFHTGSYTSAVFPSSTTYKYAMITNTTITSTQTIRFTLPQRCIVDLLLVGGGGAGGHTNGGGGGGGGIFYGVNLLMEAGNYLVAVGRGGVGSLGLNTPILSTANGQPTSLSYDDNQFTTLNFNLGGTTHLAVGYGGGAGGSYDPVVGLSTLNGYAGGSGGGSTENAINAYALNVGGSPTQGATFWNSSSYVVGGTIGLTNTTTASDNRGGGGGGGTASSPAHAVSTTCGKVSAQVYLTGSVWNVGAGGGSATYGAGATTTLGLGGAGSGGIFGGYGAYYDTTATSLQQATDGNNNTGSGGGGSGILVGGGLYTKAGNGGTGICIIKYRLAERQNSCSVDFIRNQSALTGYSVGNYAGQFNIGKENFTTPSVLVNPLGLVSIGGKYATQIFQVGDRGGRLRIANDEFDFTQIGVNDEYTQVGTIKPCIKIFGTSRTDGKAGNIEHTCGVAGKHIFGGNTNITGTLAVIGNITAISLTTTSYVKTAYVAFHALATHASSIVNASTIITGSATNGWNTILINNAGWNATTGFFTCPVAGIYCVSVSAWSGGFANCGYTIRKNATTSIDGSAYGGGAVISTNSTIYTQVLMDCVANTTISVWTNSVGCYTAGQYSSISISLQIPL